MNTHWEHMKLISLSLLKTSFVRRKCIRQSV